MHAYLSAFLTMFFSFIIQVTVAPHFKVFGVQPDLILTFVVIYAFFRGPREGALFGFFGGLLQDLTSTHPIGLSALTITLVGYFISLLKRTVFPETVLVLALVVFFATLFQQLAYTGILFLIGGQVPFGIVFFKLAIPMAFYNSLISPFFYFVIHRFVKQEEEMALE